MITKEVYDEIASGWEPDLHDKKTKVYSYWKRVAERMPFQDKELFVHLKDRKVLEFGCNAGIQGYQIAQLAASYFGVEPYDSYIKQAVRTLEFMPQDKPCEFFRGSLADFVKLPQKPEYDALYCSFVLYHFNDEEVSLLKKQILPNCKLVVVANRLSTRKYQKNKHRFEKPENVIKFLKKRGFKTKLVWPSYTRKFWGVIAHAES